MSTEKEQISRELEIEANLLGHVGEDIRNITIKRPRRIFVEVERRHLIRVMSYLQSVVGMTHLSTITGKDTGLDLEVLYHLNNGSISLTLCVTVPRSDPHLPTIGEIYPGSFFYERELESLFGFVIDGLPEGRRYPVAEDWPEGSYPLRKDWTQENDPSRYPAGNETS